MATPGASSNGAATSRFYVFLRRIAPALLCVALACGEDPQRNIQEGDQDVEPDTESESVTAIVGPKGGTLKTKSLTLTVPEGALDKEVTLTATAQGKISDRVTADLQVKAVSPVYKFGPEGTVFKKDVQLTLRTEKDHTKERPAVYFTKYASEEFENIGGTAKAKEIAVSVRHFSQAFVAINAPEPMPTDELDASMPDASMPDASMLDASMLDASMLDASMLDADTHDASGLDADMPDAETSGHADAGELPEPPFASTCVVGGAGGFSCGAFDDFDVSKAGKLALLRLNNVAPGQRLELECFDARALQPVGRAVVVDNLLNDSIVNNNNAAATYQVRVAPDTGAALVTYAVQHEGVQSQQLYSRLFDAQCKPLTSAIAWPMLPTEHAYFDVAMRGDGAFALAWSQADGATERAHVAFYDASGTALLRRVMNEGSETCTYGLRVALNAATGAGAVSCQGHASDAIWLRRFDSTHAWTDAAPVRVNAAGPQSSSWYESHILGMNENGEHVVEWQVYSAGTLNARFYDAANTAGPLTTLKTGSANQGYDGFRSRHVAPALLGTDFLLYDDLTPTRVYRYSGAGTFVGCAFVPDAASGMRLRTDGVERVYTRTASRVVSEVAVEFASACPLP